MINESGKWFFTTPTGQIHEGDDPPPPNGSTLFAAPGGPVDADLAARHKMTERLGKPVMRRDAAGDPLVERGGRAYAASVLAEDDPDRKAVEAAAQAEAAAQGKKGVRAKAAADDDADEADDAGKTDEADDAADAAAAAVKVKADAQGKAVRLGDPTVEDKSVSGPPQAKRGPTRPTPKGK